MGSMHTGLEEARGGLGRLADFYAARARGGVGLIVTGGIAPNDEGAWMPGAATLTSDAQAERHRVVTAAVHGAGGRICLQILHTGRYAVHPRAVAPSALQAPISPVVPREMAEADIERTIADFARCAQLACGEQGAGYDGVEVMGSEGYLINQFLAPRTNRRTDAWGGSAENRRRFAVEVVRAARTAIGPDALLIYRLSLLDLVEGGSTWDEIAATGRAVADAGADIINSGIGWHEARIPTIAAMVPHAAFAWATRRLRETLSIPVVVTNRINDPEQAELLLAAGDADLVSMARPFLADADFVAKAAAGRAGEINTCIACNQACLDNIFEGRSASCVVNPAACREAEFAVSPAPTFLNIGVVGAGPAGLACATTLAMRGHKITLFEAAERIGGQFNLAARIPGKEDYAQTIRYFEQRLSALGVDVRLAAKLDVRQLNELKGFDHVVLATGVTPRRPDIPGIEHPMVAGYADVIAGRANIGRRVAIVGAGGIGFDVAELLSHVDEDFLDTWGIDREMRQGGGIVLAPARAAPSPSSPPREIFLLQRKPGRVGAGLAKTTGWIRRLALEKRGVKMLGGVEYLGIDDDGLRIRVDGAERLLTVDTVVVCAGQESQRELETPLIAVGVPLTLIGGADVAGELDAKRAIEQGTRVGLAL